MNVARDEDDVANAVAFDEVENHSPLVGVAFKAIGGGDGAKILNRLGYQNELPDDPPVFGISQVVQQLLELRGSEHRNGCLV